MIETNFRLSCAINGQSIERQVPPVRRLLDLLRDDLELTGAKPGCEIGRCGACMVLVDGQPMNACLMMAYQCEGRSIVTIEGLSDIGVGIGSTTDADADASASAVRAASVGLSAAEPCAAGSWARLCATAVCAAGPHPIQRAIAAEGGLQCGYCTPGVVISLAGLFHQTASPSREQIEEALSGNLCRCTGYEGIVRAAMRAASHPDSPP